METLVIYDRQPLLRLGLKLVIEANYQSFSLQETGKIDELSKYSRIDDVSIVILGLDLEYDKINPKILKKLKCQFPKSSLIIYSDNIHHCRVLSYFNFGIAAYVSKQGSETELISCIRYVMDNKRYISSKVRDGLINDPCSSTQSTGFYGKLNSLECKIASLLINGWPIDLLNAQGNTGCQLDG